MKSIRRNVSLAGFMLSLGLGSSASAVDLVVDLDVTGVYAGKLSCSGLDVTGDAIKSGVPDSELQLSQDGTDLLATIDGLPFAGTVVLSSRDPEKRGVATVTACNNDGDEDGRLESVQLTAKASSDARNVSVKLVSVRGTDGSFVCTGSYRRTGTAEPPLAQCPVLYSCVCVGLVAGNQNIGCGNGGAGGDGGQVVPDVTQSFRDLYYVNGNDTGWVCVPQ